MNYTLENGKNIRIPDKDIQRLCESLDITKEDAIDIWLEDEGYLENDEQNELDKKAKESKITQTIHQAKADRKTAPRKVERKPDKAKEDIIATLAETLAEFAENVQIVNIGKLITFSLDGDTYKLDLIRQRPPKAKK